MSANLYEVASGRSDPQLNVDWDVQLVKSLVNVDLTSYVEAVKLPSVRISQQSVHREGRVIYLADREETGQISLKFYEDVTLIVYRYLWTWFRQGIRGQGGVFHPSSHYKGSVILRPMDVNQDASVEIFALGVWPMGIPEYSFESANAERMNPEIEFSCDDIVIRGSNSSHNSSANANGGSAYDPSAWQPENIVF